jgi:DNA ligase (NAD+)
MEELAEVKKEISRLSDQLRKHQKHYYVDARPTISDHQYDRMLDRLLELERQYPSLIASDSPSQRVGSDLGASFPEVSHTVPVLSLDKAYSTEAMMQWVQRIRNRGTRHLACILEEKMDGVSLVLYYEEGLLVRAVTRGNGFVGNDVTPNAKTISSVPLRLTRPVTIAVRGEVFLLKSDFTELNRNLDVPYANPRNLAAGTLRRLKSSETAKVPLRMYVYEAYGEAVSGQIHTHAEVLSLLNDLGFPINPHFSMFTDDVSRTEDSLSHLSCKPMQIGNYHDVAAYIEQITRDRASLPYEIDGLVMKVDELAMRDLLGYTGHHPRWALAYKFDAPESQTVVKSIDVQVGRTGRITPVARVEKVKVGNSMVSNVTLHNQDYIEMLELAIGDTVAVSKRGDVIPAVERVIEKNEDGATTWTMPLCCPSCNTPLIRNGAHQFCPNSDCPDQVLGRISFFVGREQMDIDGMGPETVAFLYRKGLLQDIPDIYRINYRDLIGEPGFGERKVQSLETSVQASRQRPFRTVLVSLGIPDFGKKAVDLLLSSGITHMQQLLEMVDTQQVDRLLQIKGFGEKTVSSLFAWFSDTRMRSRIAALAELGLQMEEHTEMQTAELPQIFLGQIWCVTGSFTRFSPRSLVLKEIEARGGRTVSSITGKTSHLLAGTGAGSKLQQAEKQGVEIVSEEAFISMLKEVADG